MTDNRIKYVAREFECAFLYRNFKQKKKRIIYHASLTRDTVWWKKIIICVNVCVHDVKYELAVFAC